MNEIETMDLLYDLQDFTSVLALIIRDKNTSVCSTKDSGLIVKLTIVHTINFIGASLYFIMRSDFMINLVLNEAFKEQIHEKLKVIFHEIENEKSQAAIRQQITIAQTLLQAVQIVGEKLNILRRILLVPKQNSL